MIKTSVCYRYYKMRMKAMDCNCNKNTDITILFCTYSKCDQCKYDDIDKCLLKN